MKKVSHLHDEKAVTPAQ